MKWGYNNIRVAEGDKWKTAFLTKYGLYECLVMFFGLCNSPATFQTMMNTIFHDLIIAQVITVYMDDILVFTKTIEEHRRVTTQVMQILLTNDLFLKPTKCYFEVDTVKYLGFIISVDRISMDPVKIEGILEWPVPMTLKEVQSFLGFGNFYRCFIQDFATLARPLNDVTKKDTPFVWSDACHNAFTLLKRSFTSSPILIYPNHTKLFWLETNASDFASGAILSQEIPGDGWHLIAYLSKSFNSAEQNYDIFDKELLAVIHALDHWRVYLEGTRWQFENMVRPQEPSLLLFFQNSLLPSSPMVTLLVTLRLHTHPQTWSHSSS